MLTIDQISDITYILGIRGIIIHMVIHRMVLGMVDIMITTLIMEHIILTMDTITIHTTGTTVIIITGIIQGQVEDIMQVQTL